MQQKLVRAICPLLLRTTVEEKMKVKVKVKGDWVENKRCLVSALSSIDRLTSPT